MVKTASAVDWYAKEHLKLLVQLENKELTLGEYVVKHQDILQKAKSIEDLTSLKKRNTELQDQVLLNDTTNKLMEKQTAVEWLQNELVGLDTAFSYCTFNDKLKQAKQMEKEQIMKAVDRGFDEGCKHPEDITLKDAEQYYNETFGK
jgi:hypothetical protein